MDDATFKVSVNGYTARKLTATAQAAGVSPEELVAMVLDQKFFDYDDFDWPEGEDPRADDAARYDLNEPGRPWSEVRPEMEALLERLLAEKK